MTNFNSKRKIGTLLFIAPVAIGAIFLLSSCSSLLGKIVKDPKIKLERVDVKDATVTGAKLNFILSVLNPNDYEIKVDQVEYKVYLGEKYFAEAKTEKPVSVTAGQTTEVVLPLPIEYSKLFGGILGALTGKSVTYKVEGKVKLNFLGLSIPFTEAGKLSL